MDSIKGLKAIYDLAAMVGGITKSKKLKTTHGLKDKYQEFYLEKITLYLQSLSGYLGQQKQDKVDKFVKSLQHYLMNPAFCLKGKCYAYFKDWSDFTFAIWQASIQIETLLLRFFM